MIELFLVDPSYPAELLEGSVQDSNTDEVPYLERQLSVTFAERERERERERGDFKFLNLLGMVFHMVFRFFLVLTPCFINVLIFY